MTLHEQFLTMEYMLACGILISAVFDLYRVLASELRIPRLLWPILDLLYWAFATLLVFRALFLSNYGQVRIFVFLALLTGVSAYFALLSPTIIRLIRWMIEMVRKLIQFLQKLFRILIWKPLVGLYKLIVLLLGFLAGVAIFLGRVVLQLLYPVRLLGRVLGRFLKKRLKMPRFLLAGWDRLKRWLRVKP